MSVPVNLVLVTTDVRSDRIIPNNEGIVPNKKKYDSHIHKTLTTENYHVSLNNFVFNSKFYLQIKGSTMGTICGSIYASIFMGKFERKYTYPLTKDKPILFLRYINDIFMVWIKS